MLRVLIILGAIALAELALCLFLFLRWMGQRQKVLNLEKQIEIERNIAKGLEEIRYENERKKDSVGADGSVAAALDVLRNLGSEGASGNKISGISDRP